jgi:fructose-1,6-bisphosphatase I
MAPAPSLKDYLAAHTTPEIGRAILGLSGAACETATQLAMLDDVAALEGDAAAAVKECLIRSGVRSLAMPNDGVTGIDADGGLAVAVDPLTATTVGSGTLFSIYPAAPGAAEASFLRPGTDQVAAGCILYGPRTRLALTLGRGTAGFVHDRSKGGFCLATPNIRIPSGAAIFATNTAEYRYWEAPVQRFIDDCLAGADGPGEQDFDMRWTGSLAAETQRILSHGGIYLAPHGTRSPHPLICHGHPVAMLIEQAGGQATDGQTRLLDSVARALDSNSPLVFGSPGKVARVAAYHDLPDSEASPLFGKRGLFRF